jgi:rhamnogalacturonyl hydrolase YesR
MYMITTVQLKAYRATGDAKYIDRAAVEMTTYLDKLQQSNGLFYHAPDVPFFWGRGNGWGWLQEWRNCCVRCLSDIPAARGSSKVTEK